jgi:signal transduction histidine kinase
MHLSHEMRTPLKAILALSELLRDGTVGALNAEQKKYIEVIERNGENLVRLVNDVLDLSQMDLARIAIQPRTFSLDEQLRAVVAALAPLATIKGIALTFAEPADELPLLRCDPDRLRQILTNLIGNAIKFTDRGRVVVSAESGLEVLMVHVTDTGVGIPACIAAQLFDQPFQASVPARQRLGQGAGLGLAITQRLLWLMGGDISVRSQEGSGSRFSFSLPSVGARPRTARRRTGRYELLRNDNREVRGCLQSAPRSQDERYGTDTSGRR